MLIIAGYLYVTPEERDRFVELHKNLLQRAREAPGCRDIAITADPLEPGRVNNFELWESEEHLAAWREVANSPRGASAILDGDVKKYQISSSGPPF